MTPGRPTALCTTPMFLLALTAGVTVQLPRMLCRIRLRRPGQKPPGFGNVRVTPNRPAYAQIRLAGCQDLPGAYGGRNARMTGRCRLPHREAAMRLRPRRRNLVIWSSTAIAV